MKFTFTITTLVVIAACLFMGACNKGTTGGIPFYLKMDTAVVRFPNSISASSQTQGIQDVWVQEGANNIGAYELPCNFPVLDKDSVRFVIQPGVWQSAQNTNPVVYPLMNPDVFTMKAVPGNRYTHVPTFTYIARDTFQFNEDFESGTDYNSGMVRTNDSAKYGNVCGKITVGPNDSSVTACQAHASGGNNSVGTACPYYLRPGAEIWVELDYRSDVPFWTGVIANFDGGATDTIQVLFLLQTNIWSKEYIKLSETISQEGANSYSLFFKALNPSGFAGGSVYLDNIRLIKL